MAKHHPKATPSSVVSQEEPTIIQPDSYVDEGDQNYDGDEIPGTETPSLQGVEALAGQVQTGQITTQDLASAIMALVQSQRAQTDAIEHSTVRKVPYANFKRRSSFNPTGKKGGRKLRRRCYQNGYPMNVVLLHDEEIEILNRLQKGKYLNGIVYVHIEEKGDDSTLDIRYRNKTIDEKMELKNEFRNLSEFLRRADREGPMED